MEVEFYYSIDTLGELMSAILSIAGQVLLALATWNDARAHNNRYALVWALLVGFVGWIPGIIYLCLRQKMAGSVFPQLFCPRCRAQIALGQNYCMYCGTPAPAYYPENVGKFCTPEESARRMAKAKWMMILGLVFFGLSILITIATVVMMVIEGISYAEIIDRLIESV